MTTYVSNRTLLFRQAAYQRGDREKLLQAIGLDRNLSECGRQAIVFLSSYYNVKTQTCFLKSLEPVAEYLNVSEKYVRRCLGSPAERRWVRRAENGRFIFNFKLARDVDADLWKSRKTADSENTTNEETPSTESNTTPTTAAADAIITADATNNVVPLHASVSAEEVWQQTRAIFPACKHGHDWKAARAVFDKLVANGLDLRHFLRQVERYAASRRDQDCKYTANIRNWLSSGKWEHEFPSDYHHLDRNDQAVLRAVARLREENLR